MGKVKEDETSFTCFSVFHFIKHRKLTFFYKLLFSELLEIDHIASIYNFFIACLLILTVNTVVHDYLDNRR